MTFFKICVATVALFFSSWAGAAIGDGPPRFQPDSRAVLVLQCLRSSECHPSKAMILVQKRPHFIVSVQTAKGEVTYIYPFGTRRLEIMWGVNENRHVWFIDTDADGVVDEIIDINTVTKDETSIVRGGGNAYTRAQMQYVEFLRLAVQVLNLAPRTEVKQ
jgi:hypothetical protein